MLPNAPNRNPLFGRAATRLALRDRPAELKILKIDWFWIAAVVVVALVVSLRTVLSARTHHPLSYLTIIWLPITASFAYVAALALKDRTAAIVAGFLTATSITLATVYTINPQTGAAVTLATICWILYFQDWFPALGICAGLAVLFRPELIFLGVILFSYGIFEKKSQITFGAMTFVAVLIGCFAALFYNREQFSYPLDITTYGLYTVLWALSPFILWFIFPFLTELASASARKRWLPITTWLVVFAACVVVLHRENSLTFTAPAFVAGYILASAGVARVLPAVSGDMPTPLMRYSIAVVSVIALIGLRFVSDSRASRELLTNLSPKAKATTSIRLEPPKLAAYTASAHKQNAAQTGLQYVKNRIDSKKNSENKKSVKTEQNFH
jgi:hypothetical protein